MRFGGGGFQARQQKRDGLFALLRNPPGGRDARIMLMAQFLDRTGSGVWAASAVLYFTVVVRLEVRQVGLMLGVAGIAGIAGSPLAGRLVARFRLRPLLIGCHLLRMVTLCLVVVSTSFDALLPVVAATYLVDRAAKALETLFATQVAGERRSIYRALSRSSGNSGYALGAGVAAIGLGIGTGDAYRALVLCNAVSFLAAAVLVRRTREPGGGDGPVAPCMAAAERSAAPSPWRDRGYLAFVSLDIPMNLDDSVLNVGIPLWLVKRTAVPHVFVPVFLLINTVLVVVLQVRVSRRTEGPYRAVRAVGLYGLAMFACSAALASTCDGGMWWAAVALVIAALLVTFAELMRSVSSWELAVSFAPKEGLASYLGVAGISQSVQQSVGPPLLTGVVMIAGPVGWLGLGTAVAGLSCVQRWAGLRRLEAMGMNVHTSDVVRASFS